MTHSDNTDQIQRTLTLASHLAEVRQARVREAQPAWDAATARTAELLAARRRLGGIKAVVLGNVDAQTRFDDALRRHEGALREVADASRRDAINRSTAEQKRLRAAAAAQAAALAKLAPAAGTSPAREFLDRPFLIWPTQGVFFADSAVAPAGSWAKFSLDSDRSYGYEEMSFYFLWSNPSTGYAVINVDGYLVLNGHGRTGSDGGFFPGTRYSHLNISAKLYLLEWWNQPPTQPFPQPDTNQLALGLSTDTGGWGDPGAIEFAPVFRGFDLRHTQMLVPPGGVVVFEVAAGVSYSLSDGSVNVDFASGDFEVLCPGVLVTVLT